MQAWILECCLTSLSLHFRIKSISKAITNKVERKNSKKDVRAYDTWVLLDSNNRNTLDFNISDYYMFLGYESQV